MANALNWFEIPVHDMHRAVRFYSTVLGVQLEAGPASEGYLMATFPADNGVGGALLQGEGYVPSTNGAVVYLNGSPDLAALLDRVEPAGGKVLVPKTDIGENGFMAFFLDTEGNKVGLHSMR
jgi:predicted enzyme related to lactoylglutathione lyase